jgi:hypothetical protein
MLGAVIKLLDLVQGLFPPINLKEQTSSLMCFHFSHPQIFVFIYFPYLMHLKKFPNILANMYSFVYFVDMGEV